MDKFLYKKSAGITALSASISEFKYKKHAHIAHLNKHFKRAYGTTAFEYISHLKN
ncbi:hypothetical protein D3C71_2133630 [compost metagenome]